MDYRETKQLLDKYFKGYSTLEEEKRLRRAMQQPDLPAELQPYRPLFRFTGSIKPETLDEGFEQRFWRKLEQQTKRSMPLLTGKHRPIYTLLTRVAAVVLLAFGIWFLYPEMQKESSQSTDWSQYEPKTPEEAFRITRAALLRVSQELNEGAQKAAEGVERVNGE